MVVFTLARKRSRSRRFVLLPVLVTCALAPFGCGDAGDPAGALPLVTIAECRELGGAPLFDPEDERSLESSCPDGLAAIAEFDEDFYGSQGGICCTSPAAANADLSR
jgi:hypothetical protein